MTYTLEALPRLDLILVRGGGDLASGIALRLHNVGLKVVISELPQPLAVRRSVSFSEAVYAGIQAVEGVTARLVTTGGLDKPLEAGEIPVVIDPDAEILKSKAYRWSAVVDARMMKSSPAPLPARVPLQIGLGPGFHAGRNCDAVIETRRSHALGRVLWVGSPQPDSGLPDGDPRRVLRAPVAGEVMTKAAIGELIAPAQVVASIRLASGEEQAVISPIGGVLRGMLHGGVTVPKDMKIGDVDPRGDPAACFLVSDKALSVAGGVLEALLAFPRRHTL